MAPCSQKTRCQSRWCALDGSSYLTRHSFEQIGERNPTACDLSHPAWQWDEQAVQSTNQRLEGLAINALLVQLYQPDLLSTGPAAKVHINGKDFGLDRSPRAATPSSTAGRGGSGTNRRPHWRRGHWHTVLHGEKRQRRRTRHTAMMEKTRRGCRRASNSEHLHLGLRPEHPQQPASSSGPRPLPEAVAPPRPRPEAML